MQTTSLVQVVALFTQILLGSVFDIGKCYTCG
jgi:hypothetical protein